MSPDCSHAPRAPRMALLLLALATTASAQHTMLHASDLSGTVTFDRYGFSSCALGDLDGDGITDYAVGAPGHFTTAPGRVMVHSGADGSLLYVLINDGSGGVSQFGWSLAGVGDVDGDLVPDILVGAPGGQSCGFGGCIGDPSGLVRLYSGHDGSLLREWAGLTEESYGLSVAAPGDVDHDGVPDVLAGAPGGGVNGLARMLSGADGSLLFELSGGPDAYRFGEEVAVFTTNPGVPGAARPRFVVRGGRESFGETQVLRVFAENGAVVVEHVVEDVYLLAAGGDADGDGVDDVLVGTFDGAFVLSGVDGSLATAPLPGSNGNSGTRVFVGDVDADGRDDFSSMPVGLNGSVVVRSGRTAQVLAKLGIEGYGLFGTSVLALGDVNRDGHADFLVGSPGNTFLLGDVIKIYGAKGATVHSGVDIPFVRLPLGSLPGALGSPTLRLAGTPAAGDLVQVTVGQAAPGAPVALVFGTLFRPFPFLGGTAVPSFEVVRFLGSSSALGTTHVDSRWPAGLAPGDLFFAQAWVLDATAPEGWAASDAVEITAQ